MIISFEGNLFCKLKENSLLGNGSSEITLRSYRFAQSIICFRIIFILIFILNSMSFG